MFQSAVVPFKDAPNQFIEIVKSRQLSHTHQQLCKIVGVVGVAHQLGPRDRARVRQLRRYEHRCCCYQLQEVCEGLHEHWVSSTHLELTLLDAQLAEEPVHDVAGQEKDIGVAVLVHAHL